MTLSQYSSWLWLPWQIRVYPPWRVNRARQPKGRRCKGDQQSCKHRLQYWLSNSAHTKATSHWVVPAHPSTGWSKQDCLTVRGFLTCIPMFLCSCKHPQLCAQQQGFHALKPMFKRAGLKHCGLFFLNKQNLLAWLNSWQCTSKKAQLN